ncbi:hypothetical protein GBAR_LOCUS4095 [Geodia barretti]|uniref:Uncharacterized protein n=1 Tax=Geodia barretti TaxID=519541 RepID=A0AA35R5Y8_GEOBA|nr:hypothetical protein GBAR_LOCUS4095 [Geodia barretti]
MSGDLSEPHRVPGCELDQFEDDSLIQSTLPKTELKNGKIICDGPTQLPLSQQMKSGEENVNFLKDKPSSYICTKWRRQVYGVRFRFHSATT